MCGGVVKHMICERRITVSADQPIHLPNNTAKHHHPLTQARAATLSLWALRVGSQSSMFTLQAMGSILSVFAPSLPTPLTVMLFVVYNPPS